MRQKLLSVLLAVLVVCGIAIPAYAAESPVLSKECKVLSNTVIYNYVMLAAPYSRGVKGDAVYCRIVDRVRDDDGNAYQVADSAQLRTLPNSASVSVPRPVEDWSGRSPAKTTIKMGSRAAASVSSCAPRRPMDSR